MGLVVKVGVVFFVVMIFFDNVVDGWDVGDVLVGGKLKDWVFVLVNFVKLFVIIGILDCCCYKVLFGFFGIKKC